jgi:hypothetical protein
MENQGLNTIIYKQWSAAGGRVYFEKKQNSHTTATTAISATATRKNKD